MARTLLHQLRGSAALHHHHHAHRCLPTHRRHHQASPHRLHRNSTTTCDHSTRHENRRGGTPSTRRGPSFLLSTLQHILIISGVWHYENHATTTLGLHTLCLWIASRSRSRSCTIGPGEVHGVYSSHRSLLCVTIVPSPICAWRSGVRSKAHISISTATQSVELRILFVFEHYQPGVWHGTDVDCLTCCIACMLANIPSLIRAFMTHRFSTLAYHVVAVSVFQWKRSHDTHSGAV